jgi:hypothetical protein
VNIYRLDMGAASEKHEATIDADLVAAQFDVLDSDTHRKVELPRFNGQRTLLRSVNV